MVTPINYVLPVADPLEQVRRGVEFGQAQALRPELLAQQRSEFERQQVENEQADVRFGQQNVLFEQGQQDRQAALADAAREREQAIQMQADLVALADNPSAEGYADIATKYPQISSEITGAWEFLDASEKDANLRFMGQLYSSIKTSIASGNDERTVSMLEDRIAALGNTRGREDELQFTQDYLEAFRADPESARTMVGIGLSVLGQGQFDDVLGEEKTPQELALEEAKLHLTEAQIAKIRSETISETNKNSAGGLITDPKEIAEQEDKMRKELEARSDVFNATRDAFSRIQSTTDSAPGDIALIFNYMKMLDPGSVVREGEFATAQNAAGVDDRVVNLYNQLLDGTRLNDSQRSQFREEARQQMAAAEFRRAENIAGFEKVIENRGLNRQNVIFEEIEIEDAAPPTLTPDEEAAQFFGGNQ